MRARNMPIVLRGVGALILFSTVLSLIASTSRAHPAACRPPPKSSARRPAPAYWASATLRPNPEKFPGNRLSRELTMGGGLVAWGRHPMARVRHKSALLSSNAPPAGAATSARGQLCRADTAPKMWRMTASRGVGTPSETRRSRRARWADDAPAAPAPRLRLPRRHHGHVGEGALQVIPDGLCRAAPPRPPHARSACAAPGAPSARATPRVPLRVCALCKAPKRRRAGPLAPFGTEVARRSTRDAVRRRQCVGGGKPMLGRHEPSAGYPPSRSPQHQVLSNSMPRAPKPWSTSDQIGRKRTQILSNPTFPFAQLPESPRPAAMQVHCRWRADPRVFCNRSTWAEPGQGCLASKL